MFETKLRITELFSSFVVECSCGNREVNLGDIRRENHYVVLRGWCQMCGKRYKIEFVIGEEE